MQQYWDTLTEKTVRFIGSCSSLAAAKFKEDRKLFDEDLREGLKGEPGLAYLLAAPIALDTCFFEEKHFIAPFPRGGVLLGDSTSGAIMEG